MRWRVVRVLEILLVAGFLFQGANNLGVQEAVTVQAARETGKEGVDKVKISLPIAIVNLDEGIVKNEEKINYGSNLIETVSENIKVTGLEEARQGIEAGEYSAYIIIPNRFSDKVMTLNEQPMKSTITYKMATELELAQREKVLESIVNIYHTFSNGLSKVYTSSLLKEYHEVQDAANRIMQRDRLDMEKLLEVNGYDLVQIIEAPEMERVERKTTLLDLSKNYAANSDGLLNLNSAYKMYLQNGQSDLNSILRQTEMVAGKEAATKEKLDAAVNKVTGISTEHPNLADNNEEIYQNTIESIVGDSGILADHNKKLKEFNESVVMQDTIYKAVEANYRQLISDLDEGIGAFKEETTISATVDGVVINVPANKKTYQISKTSDVTAAIESYKQDIKQTYAQKLKEVVDNANRRFGDSLTEGESMANILLGEDLTNDNEYQGYAERLMSGANVNISEATISAVVPEETIQALHAALPEIDRTSVGAGINELIAAVKDEHTDMAEEYKALHKEYKDNVNDLKTKVVDLNKAHGDEKELQRRFNQNLGEYNLGTFINNDEVGKYAEELQNNNVDITKKVNENNENYETYVKNIYEATNNNVSALQKSIFDGQEASKKKLEGGLAAAKNSRENSTAENVAILKSFSTRLAYSRLGELENKEVYEFIAEPLILDNQSLPVNLEQKAAGVKVPKPTQEIFTAKKDKGTPQWMWIAVIGGNVLVLGFFSITRLLRQLKKEDF